MNILVVNDDGIEANGIRELVAALSQIAEVYVAAPHVQRSCAGHGLSVKERIYIEKTEFEKARLAFSVTGTPADCVKLSLAMFKDMGIKIDMVFSGINHGGNLGQDTLYSGTVSAAIEGSICGLPSVAVSVNSHDAVHFGCACDLAVRTAKKAYGRLGAKSVISINVPNTPQEEVKGIVYVPLGVREYDKWFEYCGEEDGKKVYAYTGLPMSPSDAEENTDVAWVEKGYATITALNYDFTDYKLTEELKDWSI